MILEVDFMDFVINDNNVKEETNLFRVLDRGIDDMEAGRELPWDEAFQKIRELRENTPIQTK